MSRKHVIVLLIFLALITGVSVWAFNRFLPVSTNTDPVGPTKIAVITKPTELPKPASSPSPTQEPTTSPVQSSYAGQINLIIPVLGVKGDQLLDTFSDSRSEGRIHDAIDIPAPANTPVLAAADGVIVKLFQSERGGTTIYQASYQASYPASKDKQLIFYYAHLSRYADGLVEGKEVRQGETIAYVGDTGNAGTGNFHLHFSIAVVADPKRYWEGTNINPYPLLHR